MPTYKVVIADNRYASYSEEKSVFQTSLIDYVFVHSQNPADLEPHLADMDALLVNLMPINRETISRMERCRVVSRYGVGYDNIDTRALAEKGIMLANVPDYCGEEVSDQAMALMLDCIRKVSLKDRLIRNNRWNLTDIQDVYRIRGKVLGIVGYGHSGQCLHRKTVGFGFSRVLVSSPSLSEDKVSDAGVDKVSLETLLKESDIISLHCTLNEQTRGLLGKKEFSMVKEGLILVNTSRGDVIDEIALYNFLKNNPKACAGIDVFHEEPLPQTSPLKELDNITLSDHNGWYSVDSLSELKQKAAQNILDTLIKGIPTYPVEIHK